MPLKATSYWLQPLATSVSLPIRRRCRAIYDCKADNNDELSFSKDEVIVILKSPPGSSWWVSGQNLLLPSCDSNSMIMDTWLTTNHVIVLTSYLTVD